MEERYEIKMSELRKETVKLNMKKVEIEVGESTVGDSCSMEEEWRRLKETILEVGEKVCRAKNVRDGMRRKK